MGELGTRVWPQLWRAAPRPLLIVPVGSCEQHGPHLPLDTDTRIAVALATGLVDAFDDDDGDSGHGDGHGDDDGGGHGGGARDGARNRGGRTRDGERNRGDGDRDGRTPDGRAPTMVVAPALAISASGEHGGFPGTLSLGTAVFEQVVVELVRSADWSSGVVLVNGHGGNALALQRAVATLTLEGRKVLSWWPRHAGGDAHAGRTETSLMLAIAPHLVRLADARAGRTEPISELADQLRAEGVMAVSPNGVLGDPAGATAAHGRSVLTRWRIDLIAAVDEWWA